MIKLEDKENLRLHLLKKSIRVGDCLRFTGAHASEGYGISYAGADYQHTYSTA